MSVRSDKTRKPTPEAPWGLCNIIAFDLPSMKKFSAFENFNLQILIFLNKISKLIQGDSLYVVNHII